MSVVIAFSAKARHGKNTAAQHLVDTYGHKYSCKQYSFAEALKCEVYDVLADPFNKYWQNAQANYLALPHPPECFEGGHLLVQGKLYVGEDNVRKVAWVDSNRAELRSLLQHYGTDYRRGQSPFYWVQVVAKRIKDEAPQIALITDLRFKSEFHYVGSVGGYTVRLRRYGYTDPNCDPNHVSETELDNTTFDFEINVLDGELEQLRRDSVTVFELIETMVSPVDAALAEVAS